MLYDLNITQVILDEMGSEFSHVVNFLSYEVPIWGTDVSCAAIFQRHVCVILGIMLKLHMGTSEWAIKHHQWNWFGVYKRWVFFPFLLPCQFSFDWWSLCFVLITFLKREAHNFLFLMIRWLLVDGGWWWHALQFYADHLETIHIFWLASSKGSNLLPWRWSIEAGSRLIDAPKLVSSCLRI